ncbi:hypothetical protein RHECNPAF_3500040 [Rhizobium etli CNPAF512]|nr:hypothetical protein RHECNPAF_3500040 [Rhizobium etli CNPAF512]
MATGKPSRKTVMMALPASSAALSNVLSIVLCRSPRGEHPLSLVRKPSLSPYSI